MELGKFQTASKLSECMIIFIYFNVTVKFREKKSPASIETFYAVLQNTSV